MVSAQNREAGPIYVIPQHLLFACGFGCVALGVARTAINATIDLALAKKPRFGTRSLAENSVVQQEVGIAEATWAAARALLYESAAHVWERVRETGEITVGQRIRLRMAGTHAIRQSARAVDIVYNLSVSDAIYASRAIQRRFQDAHVITQQVQGRESHYETVGQVPARSRSRGRVLEHLHGTPSTWSQAGPGRTNACLQVTKVLICQPAVSDGTRSPGPPASRL